jgi:S1-C subfamily serine protease
LSDRHGDQRLTVSAKEARRAAFRQVVPPPLPRRGANVVLASGVALVAGALIVIMAIVAVMVTSTVTEDQHPQRVSAVRVPSETEAASIESGDLSLVAPEVRGRSGLMREWGGTAVPWITLRDGTLVLATNAHVAADVRRPASALDIRFPTGQERRVRSVAIARERGIDLALLLVDGRGLRQGVDYRCLAADGTDDWKQLVPGVDVVAVGAPLGLPQTHTFGKVSALRERMQDGVPNVRTVQFDATVMPGNSGGPLLRLAPEGWRWMAIVSALGPKGIGIAIHASELGRVPFTWIDGEVPSDPLLDTREGQ